MRETYREPAVLDGVLLNATCTGAETGTVLANPGDIVTCPEGHPVYRVVETVRVQRGPKSEWFERLDNGQPPDQGVAPPCPTCGGPVFPQLRGSARYALFIDGKLASADRS